MINYLNRLRISPKLFSYMMFGIFLSVTILVWWMVTNKLENYARNSFLNKTNNITQLLTDRMNLYISSLYDIQGLFAASDEVTSDEFNKFTNTANISTRFPGISSFVYAPKIDKKQISAYEKQMSLELSKSLATPISYKINPLTDNNEFYPIQYIAPYSIEKEIAYGFDFLSEENRKTALENARDQNQAISTAKITLLSTQKPAFLIMAPIYKNNTEIDTVFKRRNNISGIIASAFRPEDLFANLLKNTSEEKGIDFEIFDGNDQVNLTNDRMLFDLDNGIYNQDKNYQPRFTDIKTVSIASQAWTIKFITTPEFETNYLTDKLPLIVLLSGFDISLLMFLVLHVINSSNDRAIKISRKIISEYKAHDKLHSHTRVEQIEIKKPKPESKILIE